MATLRKNRRDDRLAKRRREMPSEFIAPDSNLAHIMASLKQKMDVLKNANAPFPARFDAIQTVRKVTTIETTEGAEPPIIRICDMGFLPYIIMGLAQRDKPQLQFECCWAITNILSSSDSDIIQRVLSYDGVDEPPSQQHPSGRKNFVPPESVDRMLLRFLAPPSRNFPTSVQLRNQTLWTIANLMAESDLIRDKLIALGVLQSAIRILSPNGGHNAAPDVDAIGLIAWLFSNACRFNQRKPEFGRVSVLIPWLRRLVHNDIDQGAENTFWSMANANTDVVSDSYWAVSYLLGSDQAIQPVVDAGFIKVIAERGLPIAAPEIQTPCIKILSFIALGTSMNTRMLIESGCLVKMRRLLEGLENISVRKNIMFCISNICGDVDKRCLQAVITSGFFPIIAKIILTGCNRCVHTEGLYAISNALDNATMEQASVIASQPVMDAIIKGLHMTECVEVVTYSIEALKFLLNKAAMAGPEQCAKMRRYVELHNGVKVLERLQSHQNYTLYEKALELLTRHFDCEEIQSGQGEFEGEVVMMSRPSGRAMGLPPPPPPSMGMSRGLPPPPVDRDDMMLDEEDLDFGDDMEPLDYDF